MISVSMEQSNRPTPHLMWPSNVRISKYVVQSAMDSVLLKKMKKSARIYLRKNFELTKYHRIATILHPLFKSLKFAKEEEKVQTIRDLKEMVSSVPTVSSPDSERSRRRRSNDSVLSDFYDDDDNFDEVDIYIAQKIMAEDVDILKWWDDHSESYPKLHKIAMFIFAIPATSAPSERKFSLAGHVLSCLRSSLDPMKVENLLLLHSNSSEFDCKFLLFCLIDLSEYSN